VLVALTLEESVGLEFGPRKLRAPIPPPMQRPAKTQGIQEGRVEVFVFEVDAAEVFLPEDLFISAEYFKGVLWLGRPAIV
jgi:hypothetical protein